MNWGDSPSTVAKFVRDTHYTFPVVMDRVNEPGAVAAFGAQGTPNNYLLNSKGQVIAHFQGPVSQSDLASAVLKAVSG